QQMEEPCIHPGTIPFSGIPESFHPSPHNHPQMKLLPGFLPLKKLITWQWLFVQIQLKGQNSSLRWLSMFDVCQVHRDDRTLIRPDFCGAIEESASVIVSSFVLRPVQLLMVSHPTMR